MPTELARLIRRRDELRRTVERRQRDLDGFRRVYLETVAPRMSKVESLEADLARASGVLTTDHEQREAAAAAAAAPPSSTPKASRLAADGQRSDEEVSRLKERYRSLARRLHPDRAESESDRQTRTRLMARLTDARDSGNRAAMDQVAAEAAMAAAEAGRPLDAEELADLEHGRDAVRAEIATLETELNREDASALARLQRQAHASGMSSVEFLERVADQLDERCRELEAKIRNLVASG